MDNYHLTPPYIWRWSFWKLHEDVLAINVWCFTFIKKLITFPHSEISHSFWTVSRFGIVNLVICAALHSEVLFLRCLPVCFGACMDNHHGHNCWTLKQTFLKPKRKKKNGMERTGTNISQLQATMMATCWPVCILNHKPLGNNKTETEHFYKGSSMYKHQPTQLLTERISVH